MQQMVATIRYMINNKHCHAFNIDLIISLSSIVVSPFHFHIHSHVVERARQKYRKFRGIYGEHPVASISKCSYPHRHAGSTVPQHQTHIHGAYNNISIPLSSLYTHIYNTRYTLENMFKCIFRVAHRIRSGMWRVCCRRYRNRSCQRLHYSHCLRRCIVRIECEK